MQVFLDSLVLQWAGSLLLLQVVLQVAFTVQSAVPGVAKEPGLVAHQVCVSIPFMYSAYHGVRMSLFNEAYAAMHAGTYADRLYGFEPFCWDLVRYFLGFQVYDLCERFGVPCLLHMWLGPARGTQADRSVRRPGPRLSATA